MNTTLFEIGDWIPSGPLIVIVLIILILALSNCGKLHGVRILLNGSKGRALFSLKRAKRK